ncbi:Speckle-type POZ protein-like B, partial [Stegodyphus mimosarum]
MDKPVENEFTFTWIIKNFSMYHDSVESSYFSWKNVPPCDWFVRLKAFGSDKDYVDVFLCDWLDNEDKSQICYRLEALDCNEKIIFSVEKPKGKEAQNHLERKFLLRSLINDILILKFTFNRDSEINPQDLLPPLPYKNGLFSDVVLRAPGAEFKVHKAILWARWPKLVEKLNAEEIPEIVLDIESNVLEAIVKYVYTGSMDFSGYEFHAQVSVAAIKYELPHPICASSVSITCQTQKDVQNILFEWPIKNFSTLSINTVVHSQVFTVDHDNSSEWYLILHVSEDTSLGRAFEISVCRVREAVEQASGDNIFVRSKIAFEESGSLENEHIFEKDEIWKCAEFSRFLSTDPEDILTLKCELKFSSDCDDRNITEVSYDFSSPVNCIYLRDDLKNLYRSGNSADVDIIAGPKTFQAHKFILCSRSPVFKKMFESEITESEHSCIQISDVDPHIIDYMLEFLYSECIHIFDPIAAENLYVAAEKYDIAVLKKKCSYWKKSKLHLFQVIDVSEFVKRHLDNVL